MKSLMKFLAIGFLSILTINMATAQRGGGKDMTPQQRADKQTERMTEELSLNATQQKQVAKINLDFANKMAANKSEGKPTDADRENQKAMKTEHNNALKAVLTPDQAAKLDKMKQRGGRKGGKAQGMSNRKNVSPSERATKQTEQMTEILSLNNRQQQQVATINQKYAQQIEQVKAGNHEKINVREQIGKIREAHLAEVKSVLTPEQVTKLDNMPKKRGKKGNCEGKSCTGKKA